MIGSSFGLLDLHSRPCWSHIHYCAHCGPIIVETKTWREGRRDEREWEGRGDEREWEGGRKRGRKGGRKRGMTGNEKGGGMRGNGREGVGGKKRGRE